MINSLVIGNTSQLAVYFPKNYEKISARNIDLNLYKNKRYDRVYLCFAEQRTFLEDKQPELFLEVNVYYTLRLIEFFKDKCNYIVVYGTSELWNNCNGPININTPFNYNLTNYINSKHEMYLEIKDKYSNVIILYPFNFNSIHRKPGFLFSKIFDSLKNKTKIEIGDTYFYRDLIHPKYVVKQSIMATQDDIIGSGRLVFINDFIRDLYLNIGLSYEDYVTENFKHNLNIKRNIFYKNSLDCTYNYSNLLTDTLDEFRTL